MLWRQSLAPVFAILFGAVLCAVPATDARAGNVTQQPSASGPAWTWTWPSTSGTSGYVLTTDGTGITSWTAPGSLGITLPLSSITAATTTSSIDSGNWAQTWRWGTLSTGTALTLTTSSMTTGTLLNLSNTSKGGASTVLGISSTTTGAGFGVSSTISGAANSGYGIYAVNSGAGNTGYAGYFVNANTGSSDTSYGIYATTSSGFGAAVYGEALGSGNAAYGVKGVNNNSFNQGAGVYGTNSSWQGWGVQGVSTYAGAGQAGVYGSATASTGGIGVLGTTLGTSGIGVSGTISLGSNTGYGGYFSNTGSGVNYGLYASTSSAAGYAGYFDGKVNINGVLTVSSCTGCGAGGGSFSLSSITSATTTSSIDNTNNAITWRWGTLTTQTALSLTTSSLTTGTLLNLANTGKGGTSTVLGISSTTTGAGFGVNSAMSASGNTGYAGYFVNATTGAGYGVYSALGAAKGTGYAGYFGNSQTGTSYGIYAVAAGNSGYGGYFTNTGAGWALAATGTSYFSGNVGIGTTGPVSKLQVGAKVIDDNSFSYDSNSLIIVHQTPTATATLNDPKTVLMLARQGTSSQAYGAAATFNLSRYENNAANSRTRLDISLAHASFDPTSNNVMTLLSSGNVGIGTTAPNNTLHVYTPTIGGGITSDGTVSNGLTLALAGTNEGGIGVASAAGAYSNLASVGDIVLRSTTGNTIISAENGSGNIYFASGVIASDTAKMTILNGGQVGIGTTAPGTGNALEIVTTSTASASNVGAVYGHSLVSPLADQTTSISNNGVSAQVEVLSGSTHAVGQLTGAGFNAINIGTGSVQHISGMVGFGYNETSTTVGQIDGVKAEAETDLGTTTSLNGLVAEAWNGGTTGTLAGVRIRVGTWGSTTNQYGIYLEAPPAWGGSVTNDYGIYQAGSQQNYFGGTVQIAGSYPLYLVGSGGSAINYGVGVRADTSYNLDMDSWGGVNINLDTDNNSGDSFTINKAGTNIVTITPSSGYYFFGTSASSIQGQYYISSGATGGSGPVLTLQNTSGATPGTFGPNLVFSNGVAGKHSFILQQSQSSGSEFTISNGKSPYTTYLAVTQSGNVGIGTTSPTAPLDVAGAIRSEADSYVSSDFSKTSSTTLSAITGLTSGTLAAGKAYAFDIWLYTTSNSSGGIKVDLNGGSATATTLIGDSQEWDGTSIGVRTAFSSLSTTLCAITAVSTATCHITGMIIVNAGGTFIPEFAQNASNGTASKVKAGSFMLIRQLN